MTERTELSRAVDRALASVLRRPRLRPSSAEVERLCRALLRCGTGQRALLLRNSSAVKAVEVVQHLLHECRTNPSMDPEVAKAEAELAAEAAEALPERIGQGALRQDLRAEAAGCLARAHRLAYHYEEAELAWERAWQLAAGGSGDPLLSAWLTREQAALRQTQGLQAEARRLLERALVAYRILGERDFLAEVRAELEQLPGGDSASDQGLSDQECLHLVASQASAPR